MNDLATKSKEASNRISDTIDQIINAVSNISQIALSGKSLAESQSVSIMSVDGAMNSIEKAITGLIQQQSQSFDLIQELNSVNHRMIEKISDIASEAKRSAATCQVVANVSSDQSKQDEDFQSMLRSFQTFNRSNFGLLSNIKIQRSTKVKKKIGIICLEQTEFYQEIETAAIITGEKLDLQVISKTPFKFDIEKQLSAFNELTDQNVDGIIVVPGDSDRFRPLLRSAKDRGIKVVCVDADVDDARDVYITSDNLEGGRLAGKAAVKALNGKGRIYVLLCASDISTVQQRMKGFQEEVQKFNDISITKVMKQGDTNHEVTEKLLNEVASSATQFDLLYLVTAESGEMAVDLWSKYHLKNKLVILSKSNKVTAAVAQEIVTAQIVQNNKRWGESAVQRLSELFRGNHVPESEDTGMYEINRDNFVIYQGA